MLVKLTPGVLEAIGWATWPTSQTDKTNPKPYLKNPTRSPVMAAVHSITTKNHHTPNLHTMAISDEEQNVLWLWRQTLPDSFEDQFTLEADDVIVELKENTKPQTVTILIQAEASSWGLISDGRKHNSWAWARLIFGLFPSHSIERDGIFKNLFILKSCPVQSKKSGSC